MIVNYRKSSIHFCHIHFNQKGGGIDKAHYAQLIHKQKYIKNDVALGGLCCSVPKQLVRSEGKQGKIK